MNWENVPSDYTLYYGFIYLITNEVNGMKYIGKKVFWKNVKKKGKKVKVNSDWMNYYGSSNRLTADILKYGKDKFRREIISVCTTKWEHTYTEMVYQVLNKVLYDDNYYNGLIRVRLPKSPVRLRTNQKLRVNK